MPGRSHRKGITTIELFWLFPDDAAAERCFEEQRWPEGDSVPTVPPLALPRPRPASLDLTVARTAVTVSASARGRSCSQARSVSRSGRLPST